MNRAQAPRAQSYRTGMVAATAALVVAACYLFAMHILSPAIASGGVPPLSDLALQRGFGVNVFRELTERLSVTLAILTAVLAVLLARKRGWLDRDPDRAAVSAVVVLTATVATVFLLNALHGPITFRGDANDYFLMNISMSSHGTPDLRASDIERYSALRIQQDVVGQSPYDGYFVSPVDGRRYCWHFWLYPAVAAPAHWVLNAVGASPLRAYELTNVAMFLLAMNALARIAQFAPHQRLLFSGLLVASPIAWYMSWPSAEVFTASLVVVAISLLTRRRYAAAVFACGLGATMNPSLLVLATALAAYALLHTPTADRPRTALQLGAAGAVGLAAVAFNFALFHAGNIIQWAGMASARFISPHKVEAFFLSLDQGLLPYVPVVLALALAAVVRAAARRDWWVLARFAAVLVAVTLTATTIEWNSDAVGLRRHAIWIFPFLLWMGVELLGHDTRTARRVAAGALSAQLVVFALWVFPPGMAQMSAVTELVLTHAPTLYSPVPSVFAARTEHLTVPMAEALPAAFETSRGVRKVLVDDDHLDRIDAYLEIDADALQRATQPRRTEDDLLYLEFPPDSARLRVQDTPLRDDDFPITTVLGGPSQYGHEFDAFNILGLSSDGIPEAAPLTVYALHVTLRNTGSEPWYPSGALPIGVLTSIDDGIGAPATLGPLPLVRAVLPGEEVGFYAHFITPEHTGLVHVGASLVQADGSGGYRTLADSPLDHQVSVVMVPAAP